MKRGNITMSHEGLIKILKLPKDARIYDVEFDTNRCMFIFKIYNYGDDMPEATYSGRITACVEYEDFKRGKTIIEKHITGE